MTGKLKTTPPTIPGLPDPGDCIDSREAVLFQTQMMQLNRNLIINYYIKYVLCKNSYVSKWNTVI